MHCLLRVIVPVVALIAIAASPAPAAVQNQDTLKATFNKLDKNNDKSLSKLEYIGKNTGDKKIAAERRFGQLDTNKNKQLSLQEYMAVNKSKVVPAVARRPLPKAMAKKQIPAKKKSPAKKQKKKK